MKRSPMNFKGFRFGLLAMLASLTLACSSPEKARTGPAPAISPTLLPTDSPLDHSILDVWSRLECPTPFAAKGIWEPKSVVGPEHPAEAVHALIADIYPSTPARSLVFVVLTSNASEAALGAHLDGKRVAFAELQSIGKGWFVESTNICQSVLEK